jgi:disulfide bond formation protein DsbB
MHTSTHILVSAFRKRWLLGFVACAALFSFALYSQSAWGLKPCPLCIFQRIAFIALGLVFLLGGLLAPRSAGGRRAWGIVALIPALAGIGIASRHVWLTHLPPDQVPSCGPPLEFMMESNALTDVIKMVLTGSGECAKVDWHFLGLSMPEWSLAWFLVLTGWALHAAFRRR